jgi:hypothetical protein
MRLRDFSRRTMNTKTCTKCGETKPATPEFFYKQRAGKFGLQGSCKACRNVQVREWTRRNPEKRRQFERRWAEKNTEKVRAKKRRNNQRRMERAPDHVRALAAARERRYRARHPERVREARRNARERYPDKVKRAKQRWNKANPDRVRAHAARRRSTPQGRLDAAIRSGVHRGLVRGSKNGRRTFELLGYSRRELLAHLEAQFAPGMSWDNYGEWHIDHAVPLSAFNYSTPDHIDFRRAWALGNLRPLWAAENLRKNAKLARPFQPALQLEAA